MYMNKSNSKQFKTSSSRSMMIFNSRFRRKNIIKLVNIDKNKIQYLYDMIILHLFKL